MKKTCCSHCDTDLLAENGKCHNSSCSWKQEVEPYSKCTSCGEHLGKDEVYGEGDDYCKDCFYSEIIDYDEDCYNDYAHWCTEEAFFEHCVQDGCE